MPACSIVRRSRISRPTNGTVDPHQYFQRLLCQPGGRPSHDPARSRQDHQHRLGAERARTSGIAPYTATKGAIKNLTRGMCADWARHGLQVNGIAPGYFRTPLNQALVDNAEFSELAGKADAGGPLGRCRGTGRRGRLPGERGFVLRQRPHALCRWRDHHQSVRGAFGIASHTTRSRSGNPACFRLAAVPKGFSTGGGNGLRHNCNYASSAPLLLRSPSHSLGAFSAAHFGNLSSLGKSDRCVQGWHRKIVMTIPCHMGPTKAKITGRVMSTR